jgi:hypothetical protein
MERAPSVGLWRESRWHCECRRVSPSQWAATLYADDIIIAECKCDRFTLMLHTAQHWQMAVRNGHPAIEVVHGGHSDNGSAQNCLEAESETPPSRQHVRPLLGSTAAG